MTPKPDPNDPTTWPVADAVPTDIFLGVFTHDCTPYLTEEQKAWPVADAVPTDVFLGVFTEVCRPRAADNDKTPLPNTNTPTAPNASPTPPTTP